MLMSMREKQKTCRYAVPDGINPICANQNRYFERHGVVDKVCRGCDLYEPNCDNCVIAQNYNLEDDDAPCQNCEEGEQDG